MSNSLYRVTLEFKARRVVEVIARDRDQAAENAIAMFNDDNEIEIGNDDVYDTTAEEVEELNEPVEDWIML